MRDEELRRRFEGLREADASGRVPRYAGMRARALERRRAGPGWCWWFGGVAGAAAVLVVVLTTGEGGGLEELPPLLGDSEGEVKFLDGVAGGGGWPGGDGSDVLLPAGEIKVL